MSWVSVWKGAVDADWIDELGHVGFLHHQRIADIAALDIWRRAKGESQPAVEFVMTETHVRYIRELHLGMAVEVAYVDLDDETTLPQFRPAGTGA